MRVKKIFGSILAGVLIVSGVGMSANAADIAPKNVEHRDHVIELSLERASGSFNMTVPAKSILRADKSFPLEAGETVTIKATYSPFSASVDYKTLVRANGGKNLTSEQKEIHTNSAGETYGEAMVVKYLKADVDLISAVGKNGVEGYIKTSDLPHNIPDYVPYDHEIPVYENDGVTVIDSFFISSGYAN